MLNVNVKCKCKLLDVGLSENMWEEEEGDGSAPIYWVTPLGQPEKVVDATLQLRRTRACACFSAIRRRRTTRRRRGWRRRRRRGACFSASSLPPLKHVESSFAQAVADSCTPRSVHQHILGLSTFWRLICQCSGGIFLHLLAWHNAMLGGLQKILDQKGREAHAIFPLVFTSEN